MINRSVERLGTYVRNWLKPPPICAGGTETIVGGMKIHTFTESGTLTINRGGDLEVLVVGGGGGGGRYAAGGGGAGGVVYNKQYPVSAAAPTGLVGTRFRDDANLVSYWRMEGNSNDYKGVNNGSDTSITYGTGYGKFGQGASFNGSSSDINCSGNIGVSYTNPFSLSAWIYPTTLTDVGSICSRYQGGSSSGYWGWILAINYMSYGDLMFLTNSSQIVDEKFYTTTNV